MLKCREELGLTCRLKSTGHHIDACIIITLNDHISGDLYPCALNSKLLSPYRFLFVELLCIKDFSISQSL